MLRPGYCLHGWSLSASSSVPELVDEERPGLWLQYRREKEAGAETGLLLTYGGWT